MTSVATEPQKRPRQSPWPAAFDRRFEAVVFDWDGRSVAGPWGAIGTLKGDSLTVQYNGIMQLSDFEDAVYALIR